MTINDDNGMVVIQSKNTVIRILTLDSTILAFPRDVF